MTGLEPRADQIVREAVDAYLDGYLHQSHAGEMVFETKNSRYQLMDGTLFAAPDSSLIGAELVGWLIDGGGPVVASAWRPRARAVLVDRKRGRHIIVTSATRRFYLEERSTGSGAIQAGSAMPPAGRLAPPAPKVIPIPRSLPIPARLPADSTGAHRSARVHAPPRPIGQLAPLPYPSPPPRPLQAAPLAIEEDAEDLEITEEEQRPLPLVRQVGTGTVAPAKRTLLSAQPARMFEEGAMLR